MKKVEKIEIVEELGNIISVLKADNYVNDEHPEGNYSIANRNQLLFRAKQLIRDYAQNVWKVDIKDKPKIK